MNLKIRSRSLNSNQLLSLSQCDIFYKFDDNPSTGSKDILLTNYDLENEVKVTKI